jgi:hypothetical protein
MSTASIALRGPTTWSRRLVAAFAAAVVAIALIVTVAVMASTSGQTSGRSTQFLHAGHSAPASLDCLVRSVQHRAC